MLSTPANIDPLRTPVQYLPGVGPQRAELLAKLGIRRALDLLFFFPRDYQQVSQASGLADLQEGPVFRVEGSVEEVELRDLGGGKTILGVLLKQGHDYFRAVWFNQPFLQSKFQRGSRIVCTGTAKLRGFRWEMRHPEIETLAPGEEPLASGLNPVYRLTEGIHQREMQRIVANVVASHAPHVQEVFPLDFLDEQRLWPIQAALPQIHQPTDAASLEAARFRFIYQELLVMQLALALRREDAQRAPALPLGCSAQIDARIRRLLPFELTVGQQQVISEIITDLGSTRPMNRLLQGDVGSGKTVVAAYAMLVAVANGCQAALMAPTELLAQQHLDTLQLLLAQSQVRLALLTGSVPAAQRADLLARVASGEVDLLVGTQAIVQSDVTFARLGVAIIDEQHKFGVRQRAKLRQGDREPHFLVMTATPIPRTVALTVFGDLDVSLLRDKPVGRQRVHTYLATGDQRQRWWDFVRNKLRQGRQAYVVAPLVDERDEEGPSGAEQLFESLISGELEAFRVDLLHGRLSPAEKRRAMERFRSGQTQVLVATSLVEVGVDVPNANLMTIEDAQRFGLAQLHQLRGRVGRGDFPGYVCAFCSSDAAEARQRMDAFASTTDGFELAEIDFRLRGPGDLFGTKQHGLPPLRIADLIRDSEIVERARRDARQLLDRVPQLAHEEYARLRNMVHLRYGHALDLGDVG